MHAKLRSHVYEQINVRFVPFRRSSIARKIFPANLMASLAATLLSEARRHQHISYVDVKSGSCSFFWYSPDVD